MEYKLFIGYYGEKSFCIEVNNLLADGWELQGGAFVFDGSLAQAMVRRPKTADDLGQEIACRVAEEIRRKGY